MVTIRKVPAYPNREFHSAREVDDCLRLDCPVTIQAVTRSADIPAHADELRISITRDSTPLHEIIQSLPNSIDLTVQAYSIREKEIEELLSLRKHGKIGIQRFFFDEEDEKREISNEMREKLLANCERMAMGPWHSKWMLLQAQDRVDSIINSSNDGCENGHLEHWSASRDPQVAEYLQTGKGSPLADPARVKSVGKVAASSIARASRLLPIPLAPITIMRTSSATPSSAILFWLLQALGEPVNLSLLSWSTSIGFINALATARQMGMLASLDWLFDRSIKARLSGQTGHTDVMTPLAQTFPGEWRLAEHRIHGTWAVLRTPTQTVSILTGAKWQETNRREESYVVVTDPAVATFLEGMQRGRDIAAPKVPQQIAVGISSHLVRTSTFQASEIERLHRALMVQTSLF